jgi:ribose 1,5-bisphosphate isomerase
VRELTETPVVSCFLRHRGEVLLLRRARNVGSYPGRWGAVAGLVEGDPDDDARREIAEETGLGEAVALVRRGVPFAVDDRDLGRRCLVHPCLFDCARREVRLDDEASEAAWVSPVEILRRLTVPELWTSYARVAPSAETVAGDREHGAAYLGARALEVLRDRAGWLAYGRGGSREAAADRRDLAELARRLLAAQPAMAVLANRVNRVMRNGGSAAEVAAFAHQALRAGFAADDGAAGRAAALVAGKAVLTLSRSGTVESALTAARPAPAVVVAESRPGGEGTWVAERLAAAGLAVTLIPDAAVAAALTAGVAGRRLDLVLVGADAVLPSGAVVNKTGTFVAALAARRASLPCYAVAARDKVAAREGIAAALAGGGEVEAAGDSRPAEWRPLFEVTPGDLITAIVTEEGSLAPGDVRPVAAEMAALADW